MSGFVDPVVVLSAEAEEILLIAEKISKIQVTQAIYFYIFLKTLHLILEGPTSSLGSRFCRSPPKTKLDLEESFSRWIAG